MWVRHCYMDSSSLNINSQFSLIVGNTIFVCFCFKMLVYSLIWQGVGIQLQKDGYGIFVWFYWKCTHSYKWFQEYREGMNTILRIDFLCNSEFIDLQNGSPQTESYREICRSFIDRHSISNWGIRRPNIKMI